MLPRDEILRLIPHQGTMCLLDTVLDWDDQRIRCQSRSHQRDDNPLRRLDRLRAVHLCEYGAQAMAVHGGLLSRAKGEIARPGLLVSLRGVCLLRSRIDDLEQPLDVLAELLLETAGSWQYAFRVSHAGALLAEGRAAVMLLPANDACTQGATA
jgi:predicted hotdog family 3-hydroxylacyl-ACP dehydratase